MAKRTGKKDGPPVINNRRAFHDYFVDEELEAGIVLHGHEVKMIRRGSFQLQDAYCDLEQGELWLINSQVPPFPEASTHSVPPDPLRRRKLLLHREELRKLRRMKLEKGYTIIPLKAFFLRGRVKVVVGLAKGKKQYDKRETIKQRDITRELERARS